MRILIFRKGYKKNKAKENKTTAVTPNPNSDDSAENKNNISTQKENLVSSDKNISPEASVTAGTQKPGHGRMSHDVYKNHTEIKLTMNGMYQNMLLKNCAAICVKPFLLLMFLLLTPAEVGNKKYNASFIFMLMKYYRAIYFYRQENFQRMLDFPLSDSTQWHLIENSAGFFYPVFHKLNYYFANGMVIQNDDTNLRTR